MKETELRKKVIKNNEKSKKRAKFFIQANPQLDLVEMLVEFGKARYKVGRDSGYRKIVTETTGVDYSRPFDDVYEVREGGYVKHHNDVAVAIEENIGTWRILLPNGLISTVNEKDLTAISPSEFVEAVKPSKFVTN